MTINNTPWFKNPAWYSVIITFAICFVGFISWAFATVSKIEKISANQLKTEITQKEQGLKIQEQSNQIQEIRLDTVKIAGEISTIKEILIRLERKLDRR